ncbi:hypothetical protein RRG08_040720 [Elysia crispata]|uniref:Uncharacterized protein n=1 Tax=Elysia crispata TaxID=231223 RepID=A0AAE1EE54_9GAST|nr:hypothetical protein RRG08_040720 [Elysia crispata]
MELTRDFMSCPVVCLQLQPSSRHAAGVLPLPPRFTLSVAVSRKFSGLGETREHVGSGLRFTAQLAAINRAVSPAAPRRLAESRRSGPDNGRKRSGRIMHCSSLILSYTCEMASVMTIV